MTPNLLASEITIEDLTIEGPHGAIPVRTYLPSTATRGLVWVHGGAFAFGDIDQPESDWVAREMAARGVAVVTVDYRLAAVPEWASAALGAPVREGVLFPVASEEVTAAFTWASTLLPGVQPSDWSLGGASAGANLSAGAAMRLRDEGVTLPRTLLLAYGLFHAELPPLQAELAAKYAGLPLEYAVFTPEVVQLINLNYVGDPAQLSNAYAFAGGHTLEGLPPTFLLNSEADSIRASGDKFGAELVAAGVDVLMICEKGTLHGHLDNPDSPAAVRSIRRMATWLTSDLITEQG
ncbi:alpha/beta hydrolase [Paenarthrobacter nitroguajacolicus]|uniref:Alpha/beta hydrolase n=1 Tax=Paenarthrobacter nitroguajacolicus TaxID=211146 RepID=A0A558GNQ2_PAENT|nr:alpha/beta hydrolase [Paenarthrobacter nitroguajacolicus]TVU58476.1 alpha/beta hydrolase [Paenarthrobacter nitroguajacolicus]